MDIILLTVITKLISALDAIFSNAKNLNSVKIIILATVILSAIIAIFSSINSLFKKSTVSDRFNLFLYSFLGSLLGGLAGTIIGFSLGCLFYLIIPPQIYLGPEIMFHALWLITFMSLCRLISILIGGITTIKPVIKFFSKS